MGKLVMIGAGAKRSGLLRQETAHTEENAAVLKEIPKYSTAGDIRSRRKNSEELMNEAI